MGEMGHLNLYPEHHGAQCFRGEISLTYEELAILQNHISPDFRFVPVDEKYTAQPTPKKNVSKQLPLTQKHPTYPSSQGGKHSLTIEEDSKRRTKKPPKSDHEKEQNKSTLSEVPLPKQGSIVNTSTKGSKEGKKVAGTKVDREVRNASTIQAGQNVQTSSASSPPPLKETYSTHSDPRPLKVIVPNHIWTTTCKRVLDDLKKKDESSWFLVPVIPERDGVPDYHIVVKHPMDLGTIENKLNKGLYRSPYEWQQDMRQIFYNTFKYHIAHNQVWNDAMKLALYFDSLINNLPEISIYSRFDPLIHNQIESIQPTKKVATEPIKLETAPQDDKSRYNINTENRPKYLEQKKTQKASQVNKISKGKIKPWQSTKAEAIPELPSHEIISNDFIQEVPTVGHVPNPPPEQKIGINDKSLNKSQRKQLLHNLSKLAPNQRVAALQLIQDDLGILAERHASDTTFNFDTELLSIEKQKRFHIYVNQMARENTQMMLSRNLQTQEKSQDTHTPNIDRKQNVSRHPMDIREGRSSSENSNDSYSSSLFISSSSSSSSDSSPEYERNNLEFPKDNKSNLSNSSLVTDKKNKTSLPDYKPISEHDTAFQINEEIMGKHADFLGRMETSSSNNYNDNSNDSKISAWADWKGQVIKQGIVSQREGAPTRSRDEIIAESYDARI